jgi:hypothetical protein
MKLKMYWYETAAFPPNASREYPRDGGYGTGWIEAQKFSMLSKKCLYPENRK